MSTAPRAILTAILLTTCASCGDDEERARIDVVVRQGTSGLPDLQELELEVSVPSVAGDEQVRHVTTPATYDASGRLATWTVAVSPVSGGDVGRVVYRFRAVGVMGTGPAVRAQARVTFVAGRRLVLPLTLEADCVGVTCGDDETCRAGGVCTDDFVPTCALEEDACGMDADVPDARDEDTIDLGDAIDANEMEPTDASEMGPADASEMGPADASEMGPADASEMGPADASEMGPPADDAGTTRRDAGPCVDAMCLDDDACTDDRCTREGACEHVARACADGDACTTDRCDPVVGCISERIACGPGASCVDGTCQCEPGLLDCELVPTGCETNPMTSATSCGACGNRCMPPTPTCAGGVCVTCSTPADCAMDTLACTAPPTCVGGLCDQRLMPGWCLIVGACYADGAVNPANPCEVCDADAPTVWSARAGVACDDGLFCTRLDTCQPDHTCRGMTFGVCFDALGCTFDICNESEDTCGNPVRPGYCVIGGDCYDDGDHRPINGECYVCDPSVSSTSFSVDEGAPCSGAGTDWTCSSSGSCCSPPDDAGLSLCI